MIPTQLRSALLCVATAATVSLTGALGQDRAAQAETQPEERGEVQLYYLEIVTPDMDATCELLAELHGVEFGDPEQALGNARTAELPAGGRIGVRKPMHDLEEPAVRPYVLVDDITAAFKQIKAAGAGVMVPPMRSEDGGSFCLFEHGGIQHGLWQR
ncbi:MAG: hydroxylase [Planctomycetota bacterium]